MQIPRLVHRFRSWSARWLRPSFVWPEARHELRPRRVGLATGFLFVAGDGTITDITDAVNSQWGWVDLPPGPTRIRWAPLHDGVPEVLPLDAAAARPPTFVGEGALSIGDDA
jgi:hypothetical protein